MGASTPVNCARGHHISIEQSTTPAGWYTDPAGSGGKRWWDGVQWTAHLQATAPPPPPAFSAHQPGGFAQQQQFGVAPQQQPGPAPVAQTALVVQQPQQIVPQHVDPYAASNPYGLPAVQERPYVPMQNTNYGAAQQQWGNQNLAAQGEQTVGRGVAVSGIFFFALSLVGLVPQSPVYFLSYGAILTVIAGIRILVQRSRGHAIKLWPPLVGIVFAVIAILISGSLFLANTVARSSALTGSPVQSGAALGTTTGSVGGSLPAPPAFASDAALSDYEASASQLVNNIYRVYSGGQLPSGSTPVTWPTALTEKDGLIVFPNGEAAGSLPAGQVLKYDLSSDGKYFDIAVTGANRQEVAIYDSDQNVFTWVCGPSAPANCPKGGLDPGSLDSSTTTDS